MEIQFVPVEKLKPHPRNKEFFKQMQGDDWNRFVEDIRLNGIRDPLKVTNEGIIIGGEQRWLASQEVGLEKVPVVYQDVDANKALQLLLLDNLSRRHLTPIEKAKVASVLKEQWNVKAGNNEHNHDTGKSIEDIASVIGESKRTAQRLIKLNDLIPELKELVESGRLGQTSGETLAHLSREEQEALYRALGEGIAQKTVQETKELRKAVEAERPLEGEQEESGDIDQRVSSAITKQKEEYELLIKQEQDKTQSAMSMVARLQAELETISIGEGDDDERELELERRISMLSQQLADAEERARTAEFQRKEMEATGGSGEGATDAIHLGMWKQVSLLVKQLTREETSSDLIRTEVEGVLANLNSFLKQVKKA